MKKSTYLVTILLSIFSLKQSFSQSSLNEEKAFLYYLKLADENKKDFSAEYLFKFQNDTYDKYWNDEFDFNEKINNAYSEITTKVNNYDYDVEYSFNTSAEFGEYNFDNNTFEFAPFALGTHFPLVKDPNSYYCQKCNTFTDINLYFTNGVDIQYFNINAEDASRIVKARKNSSGRVNRDVVTKIFFQLTSKYEAEVNEKNHDVNIYANITKVEVYDIYGYNQRSGSQRVIATIKMDKIPEEVVKDKKNEKPTNQEIIQLKAYIEKASINTNLKKELIEIISSY